MKERAYYSPSHSPPPSDNSLTLAERVTPGSTVSALPEAPPPAKAYYGDAPEASAPGNVRLAADVDTSKPATGRVLIYSAQLQVSATDAEGTLAAAQKLCEESGGYMESLTSNSIRVRVPAGKFNEVLDKIKTLGQVLSKNITAQDVTDEYVDLQLRLKNAQALRDRMLAILEKAATVKDTLDVERELSRVREEIERIEGRLASLSKQIAFSTIVINIVKPAEVQAEHHVPPPPFRWLDQLGVEHVLQLE